MDHEGRNQCPDGALRDLTQVLRDGGAMGSFPAWVGHDASQLVPLKAGAARIALGAAAKGCELPIFLVPVGLVYFTRNRFRSSVLVQFGQPIEIARPDASPGPAPTKSQVQELTSTLDEQIRDLTINAETWENIGGLDGV